MWIIVLRTAFREGWARWHKNGCRRCGSESNEVACQMVWLFHAVRFPRLLLNDLFPTACGLPKIAAHSRPADFTGN